MAETDIAKLVRCLFDDEDLVELRCCPEIDGAGSTQLWVRAAEIIDAIPWMIEQHDQHHRFPCFGVNPRSRPGGKVGDVAECRNLYADLDGVDEAQAFAAIDTAGLPSVTYSQFTGNGVHVMWRLDKPMEQAEYRRAMNAIGDRIGGDRAVRDAARVLRMPGFENRKPKARRADGSYPTCKAILGQHKTRVERARLEAVIGSVAQSDSISADPGTFADPAQLGEVAFHPETRRLLDGLCVDGERRASIVNACYDMIGRRVQPNLVFDIVSAAAAKCGVDDPDYVDRAIKSAVARGVEPRYHAADARHTKAFSFPQTPSMGSEKKQSGQSIRIIPLPDLGEAVEPRWIWPADDGRGGYIGQGLITQMTGLWKAGKTTLLKHLIRDAVHAEGLCPNGVDGQIVVATEEPYSLWSARRDELGLDGRVGILDRTPAGKCNWSAWCEVVDFLADKAKTGEVGWVILDTVAAIWPVADENDASSMMAALTPLRKISEAGAAVLLVHHPRKSGGDDFTAARGSGAFAGFVDILVELQRPQGDPDSTERVVRASGRYEVPQKVRIDYAPRDGFTVVGDEKQARRLKQADKVSKALAVGDWMSLRELKGHMDRLNEGKHGLSDQAIKSRLAELVATGRAETRQAPAAHRGRPPQQWRGVA